MTTALFNARLFSVAAAFVSTEETRYYLNGVFVQAHADKGVLLVATDGHRLMVIHDEEGSIDGDPVIVRPSKSLIALCKAEKREPLERMVKVHGGNADVHAWRDADDVGKVAGADYAVIIDGTFPDWRRVVPRPDKLGANGFNGSYLGDFAKASKALGSASSLISVYGDTGEPCLIRFGSCEHAFGVLMPMRSQVEAAKLPSFMASPAAAEKQAT